MSQSYSFRHNKPFTKTVLVEFAKWYLEARRELLWKREHIQLKTGKKLSEILLSVLLIIPIVLQLRPEEDFRKPIEGYGEKGNIFR